MTAKAALLLTGLCLLGGAAAASAAQPTPVFTLPLGDRLDRKLPKCGKPDRPRRDFCGLKSPVSPAAKNRLFLLNKPDQLLPEWVGSGPARMFLGAAGHVDAIAVEVNPGEERNAIASISRRFGPADNTSTAASGTRTTRWRRGGVLIEVMCEQDVCLTNFLSPAGAQSRLAMQALRRPPSDTP